MRKSSMFNLKCAIVLLIDSQRYFERWKNAYEAPGTIPDQEDFALACELSMQAEKYLYAVTGEEE
jgi:hypothetical protein